MHAYQVSALVLGNNLIRDYLIALCVGVKCQFCALGIKVSAETLLSHHCCYRLTVVGVVGTNCNVVNLVAYAECGV